LDIQIANTRNQIFTISVSEFANIGDTMEMLQQKMGLFKDFSCFWIYESTEDCDIALLKHELIFEILSKLEKSGKKLLLKRRIYNSAYTFKHDILNVEEIE